MQTVETSRKPSYLLRSLPLLIILLTVLVAVSPVRAHFVQFTAPRQALSSEDAIAATLFHPSFAKTSSAYSTLYLHNEATSIATVQVSFFTQAGSVALLLNQTIAPNATLVLSAETLTGLADGAYAVEVVSNQVLASVVRTYTSTTKGVSLYRGFPAPTSMGTLYFGPFFKTTEKSSAVQIMNVGTAATVITVQVHPADGTSAQSLQYVVNAHASIVVAAGALTLPPDFTGWLQVDANPNQPLVGLLAPIGGQNSVGLYPPVAFKPLTGGRNAMASFINFIPRAYHHVFLGNGQRTTRLFLGNPEATQAAVSVTAYNANGSQAGVSAHMLSPNGFDLWQPLALPEGFNGSVVVASDKVIGVSELTESDGGYPRASYGVTSPQLTINMPYLAHDATRFTLLSTQNVGTANATITTNVYGVDGALRLTFAMSAVPPGAARVIDTRDHPQLGADFVGSMVITSDQFVTAYLDEYVVVNTSTPITGVTVVAPEAGQVNRSYNFTATISPTTVEMPVIYRWYPEYPNFTPVIEQTGGISSVVALSWSTTGVKNVVVQAQNATGMLNSQVHQITIGAGSFGGCANITEIPPNECNTLVALYNSTNGPNWTNNNGWLQSNTPCSWHAVGCTAGHVTGLYLYQNQLAGSFPTNIGDLTYLEEIHFGNNQLTGILPHSLAQLVQLRKLRAEGNQLTGQIPTLLGQLGNLEEIVLGGNQLEGAIPAALGNLSKLTQLELGSNLSGEIPSTIGNLPNLRILHLGDNNLSGSIPTTFGNLTQLETLWLYDNQLQGNLPSSLGQLAGLKELHVAGNQLSGVVPTELTNLANLEELYLDRNQFSGPIPTLLGNLTKLRHLALWDNQLTGAIPTSLSNLVNLESIYLSSNQLTGEIPTALGNLTHLTTIHLGNNQLTGELPAALSNLVNLHDFRVSDNKITGVLPAWIAQFKNLEFLYLHSNQLTGAIPPSFGQLTKLKELDLSNNRLDGPIPAELGNLTALTLFRLWNNRLTGSLPASLGNLRQLEDFHVGGNQLSGDFPQFVSNFTNLRRLELWGNWLPGEFPVALAALSQLDWLDLGGIGLTGAIPKELGQLSNLTFLSLSWNDLTGPIPPELGNLTKLTELYLSNAHLHGAIPKELGNLTNLRQLNVGANSLIGAIPPELSQLSNLENLALSNNQLEGSIPAALGQLTNLTRLALDLNRLSGSIPNTLGNLTKMERMYLHDNHLTGSLPTQLSALTSLINFHFYHTDLCEPTNAAMQNWLDSIPYLESTGLPCGATAAHLAGVVTNGNGNKLPNIAVSLHRNVKGQGWHEWRTVAGTTTDVNGAYHFAGLGQVGYSLYFADPAGHYGAEYHDNVGLLDNATIITASLGATITVNAALDAPVSPVITVDTMSGNLTTDTKTGTVTIAMPRANKTAITITRPATCLDNRTPTKVELLFTIGDTTHLYAMAPTAIAPNYQATIPQTDLTANGALAVKVTCADNSNTTSVGAIQLYDPSGRITDAATGLPIVNATVMLYTVPGWLPKLNTTDIRTDTCESHNSKAPNVSWSQPAPTTLGVLVNPDLGTISPTVNRMPTNADGRYGWDVAQGCWYVVVTAPGYVTKISPVVGVPPAVTDLDLALTAVASTTKFSYLPVIQR